MAISNFVQYFLTNWPESTLQTSKIRKNVDNPNDPFENIFKILLFIKNFRVSINLYFLLLVAYTLAIPIDFQKVFLTNFRLIQYVSKFINNFVYLNILRIWFVILL